MTATPHRGVGSTQLDSLCSLDDATRRRLYDYVVGQDEPVTRDQASKALGIDRSTVAYHLDRLADSGLVSTSFARPDGRTGPGAGRPAKHYERSHQEFQVSVPPRDYRLAAELLARAATRDPSGTVRAGLEDAAAEMGRELADDTQSTDLLDQLESQGFEPYHDGDAIRLRNCPFHHLARTHTELVCGMNLAMLEAVTRRKGAPFRARLDPSPDRCCVAFEPSP